MWDWSPFLSVIHPERDKGPFHHFFLPRACGTSIPADDAMPHNRSQTFDRSKVYR
jgi:hypothetical protein